MSPEFMMGLTETLYTIATLMLTIVGVVLVIGFAKALDMLFMRVVGKRGSYQR